MINTNKLKGIMAEQGYSQKKLAYDMGMSINSFHSKLTGKSWFDTDQVVKICELLKIDDNNVKCDIFLS